MTGFFINRAEPSEKEIFARLFQLYLHDFSAFASASDPYGVIGRDGLFEHEHFESYWTSDPARIAFLIRVDGELAGFALANDYAPSGQTCDRVLAEFFVMRKYRRAGIGRDAAHRLFGAHPGQWELSVAGYNRPALEFWRKVVTDPPLSEIEELAGEGQHQGETIFRFRAG
ncbi:MAG: GNAT family N-acetyltransferase [Rhodospirillaceae bacterium]|nr:GNAT family N-acetyltransferase [Rhodospirillaceae bacterium]